MELVPHQPYIDDGSDHPEPTPDASVKPCRTYGYAYDTPSGSGTTLGRLSVRNPRAGEALGRTIWLWWAVCRFEAQRFRMYPLEAFASVMANIFESVLYITFWYLVSRFSGNHSINFRMILSYYLIVSSLSPFLFLGLGIGSDAGKMIKSGEITHIILRPVSTFLYPWAQRVGRNGVSMLFGLVQLSVGVAIAGGLSLRDAVMLGPVFLVALGIGLAINMIVAAMAFHVTDANSIKNGVYHSIRVFRGEILPLYLMPVGFMHFLTWTPFPASQYYVATVLQGVHQPAWIDIAKGAAWAVVLLVFSVWFWRRSLRKYEGVGL